MAGFERQREVGYSGEAHEERGERSRVARHVLGVQPEQVQVRLPGYPHAGPGGRVTRYDPISIWEIDMGNRYGKSS